MSKNLDYVNIEAKSKSEEILLAIANAVANSLYKVVIPDRYGLCDTCYLEIIKHKFYYHKNGQICGAGIKIVPDMNSIYDPDLKNYLIGLNNL